MPNFRARAAAIKLILIPRPHPLAYRASRGGVWVRIDRARRTLACLVVSYSPRRFLIDVETTSTENETAWVINMKNGPAKTGATGPVPPALYSKMISKE